jgi:hypothetical protein
MSGALKVRSLLLPGSQDPFKSVLLHHVHAAEHVLLAVVPAASNAF